MKVFFGTLLTIILISCNNYKEGKVNKQQWATIDIDLEQKKTVYMSDIFDNLRYIKLQAKKDRLIGKVQKIVIRDSTIFIFEKSTPSIFMYDLSGNYINQIVIKKGRGPEEMLYTRDFSINAKSDKIITLGFKKIQSYSYDGKFLDSRVLKADPRRIVSLSDDWYALFMNNRTFRSRTIQNSGYNLLYLNTNNNEIINYLKIDKYKANLSFSISNNFPRYNGKILFYSHPYYIIYELSKDKISTRYTLNFGEYNVPQSFFKARENLNEGHNFMDQTIEKEYASYLTNFLETDQLISFSIFWDRFKAYPVFYSKNTKEAFVAEKLVNDIDGGMAPYFSASYNNELLAHIQPSDLLEKVEKLKKNNEAQLNEQQSQLIKFAENLKTFDNPIIMLGKVKSDFN